MAEDKKIKRITEHELSIYKKLQSKIVKANYRFSYPDFAKKNYTEYFV